MPRINYQRVERLNRNQENPLRVKNSYRNRTKEEREKTILIFTPEEAVAYYSSKYPEDRWWYEEQRDVCVSSGDKVGSMIKCIGLLKIPATKLYKYGYKHRDIYDPFACIALQEGEELKDIPLSDYKCTNLGRIFNHKGKEVFVNKSRNGYFRSSVVVNSNIIHTTAQRVIAYAFGLLSLEDLEDYDLHQLDVDHINDIPTDNRIENLQILSHAENIKKRDINGAPNSGVFGAEHARSIPVVQLSKDGEFIAEWGSANLAAKTLNLSQSFLCKCLKENNRLCGGYKWMYAKDYFKK